MRTPQGRALVDLFHDLAEYADDDDLVGEAFAQTVATRLVISPSIWPLDDLILEMALGSAGLDLRDACNLHVAAQVTAFVLGSGLVSTICSHESAASPPFCELIGSEYLPHRELGQRAREEGVFDVALEARGSLEAHNAAEDEPGGGAA